MNNNLKCETTKRGAGFTNTADAWFVAKYACQGDDNAAAGRRTVFSVYHNDDADAEDDDDGNGDVAADVDVPQTPILVHNVVPYAWRLVAWLLLACSPLVTPSDG